MKEEHKILMRIRNILLHLMAILVFRIIILGLLLFNLSNIITLAILLIALLITFVGEYFLDREKTIHEERLKELENTKES